MKKVEIGNSNILKNGDLKLSRIPKKGFILTICLAVGFGSLYGINSDTFKNQTFRDYISPTFTFSDPKNVSIRDENSIGDDEIIVPYYQEDPINVSLEQINSLNIIINDCNCREDFINEVCEELDKDGIKFAFTRDCKNIDIDDAVVITLDQQYMVGPGTIILAPLKNNRLGNSDALALAAKTAFYEKGFLVDGIACGQIGFKENGDGTVSERVPTNTEESISQDRNVSFVTISFGTQNTHAGLTASSIEAMLTRYYSYINSDYGQDDLIYCVESGEGYDEISDKLGTTSTKLDTYNDTLDKTTLLTGETILNPIVSDIREFNHLVPTNLYIDKTLWSK